MSIRATGRHKAAGKMDNLIRINLLDWRDAVRDERRRNFLAALTLTTLASAGTIAFVTIIVLGHRIHTQQRLNQYLEQQASVARQKMAELKKVKAERATLIRRMQVIENLQQSRSWIVHYFDQIMATVPDGVFLKALQQDKDTTTLHGMAESSARVSEYMVNLDNSPYLANPRLIVIKSGGSPVHRYENFTLRVSSQRADASAKPGARVRRPVGASQ